MYAVPKKSSGQTEGHCLNYAQANANAQWKIARRNYAIEPLSSFVASQRIIDS